MGSIASKSTSAVCLPRTTTGTPCSASWRLKGRPRSTSRFRISKTSADAAEIRTFSTLRPNSDSISPPVFDSAPAMAGRVTRSRRRSSSSKVRRGALAQGPALFGRGGDLIFGIPLDRYGVHPDEPLAEGAPHILVHPLHDADHDDQEHHADDHAQQAEEALQLLRAHLFRGESDAFEDPHRGRGRLVRPALPVFRLQVVVGFDRVSVLQGADDLPGPAHDRVTEGESGDDLEVLVAGDPYLDRGEGDPPVADDEDALDGVGLLAGSVAVGVADAVLLVLFAQGDGNDRHAELAVCACR